MSWNWRQGEATSLKTSPAVALAGGAEGAFFQTDVDINNAGSARGISASINTTGDGILVEDRNGGTQDLLIEDVDGTAAADPLVFIGTESGDRLELPVIRKTPKGQPSTAEDVLLELAEDYDLPRVIIDYRGVSKLKSTYTDKLPLQIAASTGRVHTSYHQAVAATGRLSSTDPNLQNIPIRTEEGRRIRQAFVAPQGHVLLAADYSQIELRIMAHLSGDKGLLDAFAAGEDVHRATAAEVFELDIDDVTANQRRSAKAINFGLMYGMSAFGLARQLGIARGEAQEYIDVYFDRYPGVKQYMDDIRRQASEKGYVETVFGRRLYLPEINARNAQRRQYAERSAINAPMQGTATDIIKRAMITVHDWLQDKQPGARMIMQVHDELVFEVPKHPDYIEPAKERIRVLMENPFDMQVPIEIDMDCADSWGEAK